MHHQRSACEARTTQRASTRPATAGTSGRRDPGLDQHADQQPGVQHHHERVVPAARLDAAALACSRRRCASRRPARPAARGRPGATRTVKATRLVTRGPRRSQQHQLGAEARTHRHQRCRRLPGAAAGRAGCPRGRAAPTPTTGCRSRPATRQVSSTRLARQLERRLERLDHLGAAGVADPPADVGAGQAVVGEEPVDVLAEVAPDHRRAPPRRARSAGPVLPTSKPMVRSESG